jgi:cell division protein FtsB
MKLLLDFLPVILFFGTFKYGEANKDWAAAFATENEKLRREKVELALRVNDVERHRQEQAKDPMLTERIARERFHLVKDGEIVYRYKESTGSDGR